MPKSKASYTLSALRNALAPACAQQRMSVPSLISLKNWSAQGAFRKAILIQDAVGVALDRMRRNPGAYQLQPSTPPVDQSRSAGFSPANEAWLKAELAKRLNSAQRLRASEADVLDDYGPLKLWGDQQPQDKEAEDDEPPSGHLDGAPQPSSRQRLYPQQSDLSQRIDDIENQMKLVRHDIRAAIRHLEHQAELAAGKDTLSPALSQSIEQLDSVRKHLMQRMDAEIQLIKGVHATQQVHPAQTTPSRPNARADDAMVTDMYMSMQQILSRLARIENRIANTAAD